MCYHPPNKLQCATILLTNKLHPTLNKHIAHRFVCTYITPEKERCSSVLSSLQISPVKDNTREEEEAVDDHGAGEEAVGKQPAYQLPQDYQDYANFSEWFWADDIKKRDEARHLMSETDRCCFCEYECPPPTQQEDESRILGNLMSMWDHIEVSHPVAHEWMA